MIFDVVPPWLEGHESGIRFEILAPNRETPHKVRHMPATSREIQELKHMLAWAQAEHRSGANSHLRERALRDSLAKAIAFLEEEPRESIINWVLAALRSASVKKGNEWFTHNRRLYNEAMDVLSERFPPDDYDVSPP